MKFFNRAIITMIATFAAGFIGSLFVGHGVNSWYIALNKPPLTPPDIAFPIVWIILYTLMGIAASIVWLREPQNGHSEMWLRMYFVHLCFNAGWIVFFFGLHAIVMASFALLFLDLVVFGLIVSALELDKRVSYLLLPYLAWILFATYLNLGVWVLN